MGYAHAVPHLDVRHRVIRARASDSRGSGRRPRHSNASSQNPMSGLLTIMTIESLHRASQPWQTTLLWVTASTRWQRGVRRAASGINDRVRVEEPGIVATTINQNRNRRVRE